MNLIFIGPPGVGKGTQATLLQDRTGIKTFSSGDIFRREIAAKSELGLLAQQYIDQGKLVPDSVTIQMMTKQILTPQAIEKGFILDGFPRTIEQAQSLDEVLDSHQQKVNFAICFVADDQVVIDRLGSRLSCPQCGSTFNKLSMPPKIEGVCDKCGSELTQRADDKPDAIQKRLELYHLNTGPLKAHYAAIEKLVTIDATRPPESVYQSIQEGIGNPWD